jgi:hypothetical protein
MLKFHVDLFRAFRLAGTRISHFFHKKARSFITLLSAAALARDKALPGPDAHAVMAKT